MKVSFLVKVLLLGICAILLTSYFVEQGKGIKQFDNTLLLPDLNANLISHIEMRSSNKILASAEEVLTQWQLPEKNGFIADTNKLAKVLQQLKGAKVVEAKTKKSENYAVLGLNNIDAESSQSILLTLHEGSKKIEILLGINSKTSNGRYVRFANQAQTYLVDLDIEIPHDSTDWLSSNVLNVGFEQVRKVEFVAPESTFTIVRKELSLENTTASTTTKPLENIDKTKLNDNFELVKPIAGKSLQYDSILTGLVRNLVSLSVKDVVVKTEVLNDITLSQTSLIHYVDENFQPKQTKLHFYKKGIKTPTYWVNIADDKWLLKLSEFDFKQVGKPLSDYLE